MLEDDSLKLVIAMEPRSYREAIGEFFEDVRRYLDFSIVDPGALEAEITRSNPDLVFSSSPKPRSMGRRPAWLEFRSGTYGQTVTFYFDGERSKIEDADLGDLLSIVDRVEKSLANSSRSNRH